MKKNNHLIFVGLLAVIALAIFFYDKNTTNQDTNDAIEAVVEKGVFSEDMIASIDKIEIQEGEMTTTLERQDGGEWFIASDQNFPAEGIKFIRLFNELTDMKIIRHVTTDTKEFAALGIEAAKTFRFFSKGEEKVAWHFGERREKGGQYVADKDKKNVYLVHKHITIGTAATDWENRMLLDIKAKDIKTISFKPSKSSKKKPVTLTREKPEDSFKPNIEGLKEEDLNESNMINASTALENLRFTKRFDTGNEAAKTALENAYEAIFVTFDGRSFVAKVGDTKTGDSERFFLYLEDKNEADSLVNSVMKSWSFEISSFNANKFRKGAADFQKKESKS